MKPIPQSRPRLEEALHGDPKDNLERAERMLGGEARSEETTEANHEIDKKSRQDAASPLGAPVGSPD